jgi:putative spermidine/putrescine transport system ATP-binding protein
MSFLELTGIRKAFGATVAVEDFNLAAERGEFVSFLGPSGCGKTTTLRMIAGFERPTAGRIAIDGNDITWRPPNQRNVGMVFQSYALFPNMTVAANVGFGLKVRKRSPDQIRKRVDELLTLINLPDKGDRFPWQLSGGQQQRVALARALAFEPEVLLLDEPLSALDAKIRVALRLEIRQIQRQLGITTVYVTHDQEEALSLSDRVVVMSEGRIEQIGRPFEIYNFPATPFVASFVGTLNLLPAKAVDAAAGTYTVAGQAVRVSRPTDVGTGRNVNIALRPEMASLGTAGGENHLRGEVVDVSFLGSIVRMRIRLGGEGGPVVSLDEFNEPTLVLPELGSTAEVSFPADGPLVLDAGATIERVEELIAEA